MQRQKIGARAEYREQESQRVRDSANLADKFAHLKRLTVDMQFYTPGGLSRTSQVKYEVNLANAKSVFRFQCPNHECVRGDFDLTEELAAAVAAKRHAVAGEMTCQGWRSKTTIDKYRCQNVLKYELTLGY